MATGKLRRGLPAVLGALVSATGLAQGSGTIETVEVVGTTPLGAEQRLDRIASNVQTATAEELRQQRAVNLSRFMERNLASVFVNDAQSNPLQADVQYRGFVGSPLLGLPQGIAVYQDGARVNEPFGDTVNWALIPDTAIETLYLIPGSNPLFGLNAIGGSIALRTKSGHRFDGTHAELYAGSFGRYGLSAELGGSATQGLGYYLAASYLEEDGWRNYSPTEAARAFAKLSSQSDQGSIDLSLTLADTDLIGNGAAPIELLQQNRRAIFTRPDQTENALAFLNLNIERDLSQRSSLQANVYLRDSDIDTLNGDDSDFEACQTFPGFICEIDDGAEELLLDRNDNPIAAAPELEGATVNRTRTTQNSVGFSLQAGWTTRSEGKENRLTAGIAFDESDIDFESSTELGTLDATRLAIPGGAFVGDAFTGLSTRASNASLYLTNSLMLGDRVNLTASGRYNDTEVALIDRLGVELNGEHGFDAFNPALSLSAELHNGITLYGGYSESNRAPSPVELSCADENDPCRLPNAFVADPPLEQVTAETLEAGLRGHFSRGSWHAGVFRTLSHDDILFISAGTLTNQGFFDNVGRTRRDGIELNASGSTRSGHSWSIDYSLLDASFRDSFIVPSPNNPASLGGEIPVEAGDRLPLIPRQILKMGITMIVTPKFHLGFNALASAGSHFRGDEGNFVERLDDYAVLDLRARYFLEDRVELFLNVDNLFDKEYETFGLFGEADELFGGQFQDSRFVGPAAPRAAWLGISLDF